MSIIYVDKDAVDLLLDKYTGFNVDTKNPFRSEGPVKVMVDFTGHPDASNLEVTKAITVITSDPWAGELFLTDGTSLGTITHDGAGLRVEGNTDNIHKMIRQHLLTDPRTRHKTFNQGYFNAAAETVCNGLFGSFCVLALVAIQYISELQGEVVKVDTEYLMKNKILKNNTYRGDDYYVLKIKENNAVYGNSVPTGVSQRYHMRRGHYRRYKSGKTIFVEAYHAGDKELGTIFKDYKLGA